MKDCKGGAALYAGMNLYPGKYNVKQIVLMELT